MIKGGGGRGGGAVMKEAQVKTVMTDPRAKGWKCQTSKRRAFHGKLWKGDQLKKPAAQKG